jgi:hypothetical protein
VHSLPATQLDHGILLRQGRHEAAAAREERSKGQDRSSDEIQKEPMAEASWQFCQSMQRFESESDKELFATPENGASFHQANV